MAISNTRRCSRSIVLIPARRAAGRCGAISRLNLRCSASRRSSTATSISSIWELATLTCKPSPLVEKLKALAVNDPYSGKAVTGGIITFTDSSWLLSFTCGRQPHFPNQPKDVLVLWAYALFMDRNGDFVKKADAGLHRPRDLWRSCASTSASRTSSTRSRPTPTCAPR